jgi:hypothetical protein
MIVITVIERLTNLSVRPKVIPSKVSQKGKQKFEALVARLTPSGN